MVECAFCNVGSAHPFIAGTELGVFGKTLQLLANHGTVGKPHDEPGAHVVLDREDLQLLAEFTMVPLLGLMLAIGVYPGFIVNTINAAVSALFK